MKFPVHTYRAGRIPLPGRSRQDLPVFDRMKDGDLRIPAGKAILRVASMLVTPSLPEGGQTPVKTTSKEGLGAIIWKSPRYLRDFEFSARAVRFARSPGTRCCRTRGVSLLERWRDVPSGDPPGRRPGGSAEGIPVGAEAVVANTAKIIGRAARVGDNHYSRHQQRDLPQDVVIWLSIFWHCL